MNNRQMSILWRLGIWYSICFVIFGLYNVIEQNNLDITLTNLILMICVLLAPSSIFSFLRIYSARDKQ